MRADTTVVSASVEHPTDSGLLAHAIVKSGKLVRRIRAAGGATRTRFRDRSGAALARVHAIGAKLRLRQAAAKDQAKAAVLRLTGELAGLTDSPPPTRTPRLRRTRPQPQEDHTMPVA